VSNSAGDRLTVDQRRDLIRVVAPPVFGCVHPSSTQRATSGALVDLDRGRDINEHIKDP
jgi:hypothetical protein